MEKVLIPLGIFLRGHFGFLSRFIFSLTSKISLRPTTGSTLKLQCKASEDFKIFRDIFIKKEYQILTRRPVHRIVDLGAHIGFASAFFWRNFPEAIIYAVEPNPEAQKRIQEITSQTGRIILHQYALNAASEPVDLHIVPGALASSSLFKRQNEAGVEKVQGITLSALFEKTGVPDILKIDIEGAEKYVLAEPIILSVPIIVGELHEDLAGITAQELLKPLKDYKIILSSIAPQRFSFSAIKQDILHT